MIIHSPSRTLHKTSAVAIVFDCTSRERGAHFNFTADAIVLVVVVVTSALGPVAHSWWVWGFIGACRGVVGVAVEGEVSGEIKGHLRVSVKNRGPADPDNFSAVGLLCGLLVCQIRKCDDEAHVQCHRNQFTAIIASGLFTNGINDLLVGAPGIGRTVLLRGKGAWVQSTKASGTAKLCVLIAVIHSVSVVDSGAACDSIFCCP